ncbi:hypothetical protein AB7X03_21790 [Providencia rettgeri]
MKRILITVCALLLSMGAQAVDGYKNIKFGSQIKDVMNANLCSFKQYRNVNNNDKFLTYRCDDFVFESIKTSAIAGFINGEFNRLIIDVNPKKYSPEDLLNKLWLEYGLASGYSQCAKDNSCFTSGEPLEVYHDNNTVILTEEKNVNTGGSSAYLIYTTPDFFEKLDAIKHNH